MMQDEVNKIVFNALADGREIWFPGVGSLVPEFRSAWRASARQLERPSRRIAFLLSEQRGVSVIDLIARAGACDVAAAEDIYSRWLDKARVEDGISIPGVGELNHRYFRLAARCRSQSSRTRSAAAETPIFPATPLSGDRLVLYGGCRLRNLAVRRVDAAAVRGRF